MKTNKIIPFFLFFLIFLISTVGFNYFFIGRDSKDVVEAREATLPILSIISGENELNSMHAYTGNIDKNLIRNSIIPLEGEYEFSIVLKEATKKIPSVRYTVYETDNQSKREEGVASFYEKKKKTLADIKLKNKLDTGKAYLLELIMEDDRGVNLHYYTRLKYGTEMHFSDCMSFANRFHNAALKGGSEGNEYVSNFLEPKTSSLNNTLAKVDINSNDDIVCYANMKPKLEKEISTVVTEITNDLSSIEKKMILSYERSDGKKEYYFVTEYFKVRYSVSRLFLLDYERTQEEYFQHSFVDAAKNRFMIGTTGSNEKDLHTQNKCEMAAFVQNNQLWYYDFQGKSMIKVFSFLGEDYKNIQTNYDGHGIKILSMKKNGDLIYAVYGYMNRDSHEGENGIAVYRYYYEDQMNEEILFIPTQIPYENMKTDLSKLAYLNSNHIFYFYLDGNIYKVDTSGKEYGILQKEVSASEIVSTETGQLAIQEKNQIKILNLETGKERRIKDSKSQKNISIGFIRKDFIYGIAERSDIKKNADGTSKTPMKTLLIINDKGKQVASYHKSGIYILKASSLNNTVKITRAKKTGNGYQTLVDDYIHYKDKEEEKVTFEYSYNTNLYNQLYMVFPTYVYVTEVPKLVNAKKNAESNYRAINFEDNIKRSNMYYVYTKGNLQGTYVHLKSAIEAAKKGSGVVLNSKQNYVWEKGVTKDYAKVANVSIEKAKNKKDSLTPCIEMLLKLNTKFAKETDLEKLSKSQKPDQILEKYLKEKAVNFTGCSLEDVLYCISEGRPFIAKRANGTYIVVMSYNSTKLRYIDPVKGESIQADRKKMEADFKKASNCFYSYTQ